MHPIAYRSKLQNRLFGGFNAEIVASMKKGSNVFHPLEYIDVLPFTSGENGILSSSISLSFDKSVCMV
jgi:hypothetical protein